MQVVIDIPEELLEYFANHNCISEDGWFSHSSKLLDAFRNGTPLPKGHGRLIDENDLKTLFRLDDRLWWENAVEEFINLSTIIEADKESE